jgi:hypothetical protein
VTAFGPAWCLILLTLTIYGVVARRILVLRRELKAVTKAEASNGIQNRKMGQEFPIITSSLSSPSSQSEHSCGSSQMKKSPSTNTNRVAWAYSKYAMLFFASLLVTWVSILMLLVESRRVTKVMTIFRSLQLPAACILSSNRRQYISDYPLLQHSRFRYKGFGTVLSTLQCPLRKLKRVGRE